MTPKTRPSVRALRLRTDTDGRIGAAADLAAAECLAGQAAAGARAHLHTAAFTGPLGEWARALQRGAPDSVVLAADRTDERLAALLAERLHGCEVRVCAPDELAGALARATGLEPAPGASPYATRVLAPAQAAVAGVRVQHPADTLADLELLARRSTRPAEIELHPGPAQEQTAVADERLAAGIGSLGERLVRAGLRLRPRLRTGALSSSAAEHLAAAGITRILLTAEAGPGEERILRAALSAATAAGLHCSVEISVPDTPDSAAAVGRLLRACPDARAALPGGGLAGLAARGAFGGVPPHAVPAAELRRHRRTQRAQARRALAGGYRDSAIGAGAHDLWWEHSDPVAAHTGWVADVVAAGGTVLVPPEGAQTPVHPRPVPADAAGPVRDYAADDGRGSGVLLVRTEDDRDALLADADAAWHEGVLAQRLSNPGSTLAGLCRLGLGECPAARGRRLYVDPGGRVRGGPHGPVLGKVGDPLEALRAALREHTGPGCACLPSTWAAPRPRPWLGRVVDAARSAAALRTAAARGEHPAPESANRDLPQAPPAVSGLGGPLGHTAAPAPRWPDGLVMLRDGGAHLLHHRSSGTWATLPTPLAALIELRLDLGVGAADHLVRHHSMPASQASAALEHAAAALARVTRGPDPARDAAHHP
ncbi:hypothetical protein [Streptomonospora alba]|uniref:hypothetical protein n=1 Tax=Streptomonospora alba TaxID=183763 RepID=UPI00069C27FA|nr:hypothetical protein [Streptomonospora alba]